MGAYYSFELISIVHWVPKFIGHNKIFLGSVAWQRTLKKGKVTNSMAKPFLPSYSEHDKINIVFLGKEYNTKIDENLSCETEFDRIAVSLQSCIFYLYVILRYYNSYIILKPNYFKKQHSSSSFLLEWPGVFNRLVPCLKCMELACWVLHCHFEPLLLS